MSLKRQSLGVCMRGIQRLGQHLSQEEYKFPSNMLSNVLSALTDSEKDQVQI